MSLSYRVRGNEARAHTNACIKTRVLRTTHKGEEAIKTKVVKKDKKIILVYSLINSMAKGPLPYSTLNPDTSSDSLSAKSKGVRLASAKQLISHNKVIGGITMANGT